MNHIELSEISVVVPVKDNSDGIHQLLHSFFNTQNLYEYPKEIIIVDNRSKIEVTIDNSFLNRGIKIHLLKCEKKGPAAARNKGAETATGKWLLFTDSDCVFTASTLKGYLNTNENGIAFAGNVIPLKSNSISDYYRQLNVLVPLVDPHNHDSPWYLVSANCLIKRANFMQVNGFCEDFEQASGEDVDLGLRLAKTGNLYFALNSLIRHDFKNNLVDFYTRFIRYGEGHYLLSKKYEIDISPKPIIPAKKNIVNRVLAIIHYLALKKGYFKYRD
jgi:glycosyltransferase involved in cell wall biosynthesis